MGLHCHGNGSATATVALHRASATPTTAHSRAPGLSLEPRPLAAPSGLPNGTTASGRLRYACLPSPVGPVPLRADCYDGHRLPGRRAALHAGARVLVRWLGPTRPTDHGNSLRSRLRRPPRCPSSMGLLRSSFVAWGLLTAIVGASVLGAGRPFASVPALLTPLPSPHARSLRCAALHEPLRGHPHSNLLHRALL